MKQYITSLLKLYLASILLLDVIIIFTPGGYLNAYSHVAYWVLIIPIFLRFNPIRITKNSRKDKFAIIGIFVGILFAIKNYIWGSNILFTLAVISHYLLLPITFCGGENCWGFNIAAGSTLGIILSIIFFAFIGNRFEHLKLK